MEQVHSAHMFYVPIFKLPITPWDKVKSEILSHLDDNYYHEDEMGFKTDFDNPFYYRNHYNTPIYEVLKPYIAQITKPCLGMDVPPGAPNMWSQKYYTGSEHPVHNHSNRGFSFILYLKFNPEVHRATQFFAPFDHFFTGEMLSFVPDVQEGDLIAFPSVIRHTSQCQITDEERMILAFNLYHPVWGVTEVGDKPLDSKS